MLYAIQAVSADGKRFWYTGRAGNNGEWISPNAADAYLGYSLDGARAFAARTNKMTAIHGLYFMVPVGSDAIISANPGEVCQFADGYQADGTPRELRAATILAQTGVNFARVRWNDDGSEETVTLSAVRA